MKIKIRRDTAANWSAANPVLTAGELAFDKTNKKLKVGDGTTAWNSLASATGVPGAKGATGPTGASGFVGRPPVGFNTLDTLKQSDPVAVREDGSVEKIAFKRANKLGKLQQIYKGNVLRSVGGSHQAAYNFYSVYYEVTGKLITFFCHNKFSYSSSMADGLYYMIGDIGLDGTLSYSDSILAAAGQIDPQESIKALFVDTNKIAVVMNGKWIVGDISGDVITFGSLDQLGSNPEFINGRTAIKIGQNKILVGQYQWADSVQYDSNTSLTGPAGSRITDYFVGTVSGTTITWTQNSFDLTPYSSVTLIGPPKIISLSRFPENQPSCALIFKTVINTDQYGYCIGLYDVSTNSLTKHSGSVMFHTSVTDSSVDSSSIHVTYIPSPIIESGGEGGGFIIVVSILSIQADPSRVSNKIEVGASLARYDGLFLDIATKINPVIDTEWGDYFNEGTTDSLINAFGSYDASSYGLDIINNVPTLYFAAINSNYQPFGTVKAIGLPIHISPIDLTASVDPTELIKVNAPLYQGNLVSSLHTQLVHAGSNTFFQLCCPSQRSVFMAKYDNSQVSISNADKWIGIANNDSVDNTVNVNLLSSVANIKHTYPGKRYFLNDEGVISTKPSDVYIGKCILPGKVEIQRVGKTGAPAGSVMPTDVDPYSVNTIVQSQFDTDMNNMYELPISISSVADWVGEPFWPAMPGVPVIATQVTLPNTTVLNSPNDEPALFITRCNRLVVNNGRPVQSKFVMEAVINLPSAASAYEYSGAPSFLGTLFSLEIGNVPLVLMMYDGSQGIGFNLSSDSGYFYNVNSSAGTEISYDVTSHVAMVYNTRPVISSGIGLFTGEEGVFSVYLNGTRVLTTSHSNYIIGKPFMTGNAKYSLGYIGSAFGITGWVKNWRVTQGTDRDYTGPTITPDLF